MRMAMWRSTAKRKRKRFKYALKKNPVLREKVTNQKMKKLRSLRRKFEKRGPGRQQKRKARLKMLSAEHPLQFMKYATVAGTHGAEEHRAMVHKKKIARWQDVLKDKWVRMRKRKPSLRGLSKVQVKQIKKRQKQKKLAHR